MKTLLIILLLSTMIAAQDKVSILGGVSYAPRFDNLSVNKQTLTPSFYAIIGDSSTALNLCFGNVLKCGIIARKEAFFIGASYCIDLLSNEGITGYLEIKAGVLFKLKESVLLNITTTINIANSESMFNLMPISIGVLKRL